MAETHTFVWDGMNIVLEKIAFADNSTRTCEYFWGPDKSGAEQGAGGVGGLLAVSIDGQFYIPCYDHNGNIVCYVSEAGSISAQYLYDPYGNVIDEYGAQRDAFAFGFSTKYRDRETNMLAYQRRFYRPDHGRWLNRDPIEEEGSENLYAFCINDAISEFDVEGCAVKTLADIERSYRAMIAEARKQGKNVAANNLEHFLSGNGEKLVLDWSWLRSDTTVIEADKLNQERFEGKLVEKARTLADGETISFYDYFDASKTASVFAELYYASGTFTVSSYGDFKLSRQGCIVKIDNVAKSGMRSWWCVAIIAPPGP